MRVKTPRYRRHLGCILLKMAAIVVDRNGNARPHPAGRGYQSELLYFGHANDYWTSGEGASGCLKPKPTRVVDLWNLSPDAPEGTPEGGARTQVAQCNFTELGDWSMQKVTGDRCVPGADGDHW